MTRSFLEDVDPAVRAGALHGANTAWEGVANTAAVFRNVFKKGAIGYGRIAIVPMILDTTAVICGISHK